MDKKFINVVMTILTILVMTIGNFILLCSNVVSLAAETISGQVSTNNANVEFSAVLQNGKGEEGDSPIAAGTEKGGETCKRAGQNPC